MSIPIWVLIGLLSFILFGFSSIVDKYIFRDMEDAFHSVDLSIYKMGFDGLILFLILFFSGNGFSLLDVYSGFVIGILYGISNILYYRSLQGGEVNVVAPVIQAGVVVLVFILGVQIFSEPFSFYNLIGLFVLVLGILSLNNRPSRSNLNTFTLVMVFATILVTSSHMIVANYFAINSSPLSMAAFMYLFATLVSYSYQLGVKRDITRIYSVASIRKVGEVLCGALFASVSTYLLYLSFSLGDVSKIYALSGVQSVVIFIVSVLVLNEAFSLKKVLGVILIFIGTFIVYL